MTIYQRVEKLLVELGISKREFESRCSISNGYFKPEMKSIGSEIAKKIIYTFPAVNIDWILFNDGSMFNDRNSVSEIKPVYSRKVDSEDGLPIIPFDAVAGFSTQDNFGVSLDKLERYVVPEFSDKGAEYIIRVSGSSMYPKYSNGDLLACRKIHDILFFQWGKVYVMDTSQGVMVKRIFENKDNSDLLICHSDNIDNYPEFAIPKSDIRSLSIVLGVIRME